MHIKLIYVCSLGSLAALVINQVRIYSCACVRMLVCVYVFVLCMFIFLPHFICMHELLCTHLSANCAIIARFILTYVMHSAFEIFTRTERRSCERSKLNLWYLRLRYYNTIPSTFCVSFSRIYTQVVTFFWELKLSNSSIIFFETIWKKTSTINGNGIVLLMLSKHPF